VSPLRQTEHEQIKKSKRGVLIVIVKRVSNVMHVIPLNLYLNKVSNDMIFVTIEKCLTGQISGQNLGTQNNGATSIEAEGVSPFPYPKRLIFWN
jgi:hypothetical protein